MEIIKSTNLEQKLIEIKEFKKTLKENEELIGYWDTETEGLAYNYTQLEIEQKRQPNRSKELDKIIEIGIVFATRNKRTGEIKEITNPDLSIRKHFNPNNDRTKNKQKKMEEIVVDVHGMTHDFLLAKEPMKGTSFFLNSPASSIHRRNREGASDLSIIVDILNNCEEIKAHNSAFDIGMLNAALKDEDEILRLDHNKIIDEQTKPLKDEIRDLKKDIKTAIENKEYDKRESLQIKLSELETDLKEKKNPPKAKRLTVAQKDTMTEYKQTFSLVEQLFLQEKYGFGNPDLKPSYKQDRIMNMTGVKERDLHGAEEDSRILLNIDSIVQSKIIKQKKEKEKEIEKINHITKNITELESQNTYFEKNKKEVLLSDEKMNDIVTNNFGYIVKNTGFDSELIKTSIEITNRLMDDLIEKSKSLEDFENLVFPKSKDGKNKTMTIPAKYIKTPYEKSIKKEAQEIMRVVTKLQFYNMKDEINQRYVNKIKESGLSQKIDEIQKSETVPKNPDLTYIRTPASIPMKNSEYTNIPQIVGSVKNIENVIREEYNNGNKHIAILDYNSIVDIFVIEKKIKELKEELEDLSISYGITTLLKDSNNNFSEINIMIKSSEEKFFYDFAELITKMMDKKVKSNKDTLIQMPYLTKEELKELNKNNAFEITYGSFTGLITNLMNEIEDNQKVADIILSEIGVEETVFEIYRGISIFEQKRMKDIINLVKKKNNRIKVIYTKPILHNKGDEDLHKIRNKGMNRNGYYGQSSVQEDFQPLETEAVKKTILDLEDTEIPKTEVNIPDHIRNDHEEGWNLKLDKELRDGVTIKKSQLSYFPLLIEALNKKGVLLEEDSRKYTDTNYTSKEKQITYFIRESLKGLKMRFAQDEISKEDQIKTYIPRMDTELSLLISADFDGYFLEVDDYLSIVRMLLGETGAGRGSAAGSLVAYSLEITDIDPIPYGLLFERFYNPERVSLPDIDMDMHGNVKIIDLLKKEDLHKDYKEEIEKVYGSDKYTEVPVKDLLTMYLRVRYGKKNIKNIQTKGTYQSKSAIDEICKHLGKTIIESNQIALSIDGSLGVMKGQAYINLAAKLKDKFFDKPGSSIKEELKENQELKNLYNSNVKIKEIYDLAIKLEKTHKNKGVHAAGVTKNKEMGSRSWTESTSYDVDGITTTATDGKYIEDKEQIKFDFLGLANLSVIKNTLNLIKKNRGLDVSDEINKNLKFTKDIENYEEIQKGNTTGIFQIESDGMRKLAKNLVPDSFEDVVAMLALYRPGPLESGMVDDFVERKHGRQEIDYFDETLEKALKPILAPTYGVIVYQEQVMQIVQAIGGFSLGGADLVRRAMGKKIKEEMDRLKIEFSKGAVKKGYNESLASDLFDLIVKFAGYGFNKSHSAAYAVTTMKTAYLKKNYKMEFYAALLIERGGEDLETKSKVLSEARKEGVDIKGVDITKSEENPIVYNNSIIYGFNMIKGLRKDDIRKIIESREKKPFESIEDFLLRDDLQIGDSSFKSLVHSGAFDKLISGKLALPFKLPEKMDVKSKRAVLIKYYGIRKLADEDLKTTKEIMNNAGNKIEKDKKQSKILEEEYKTNFLLSSTIIEEYERTGSISSGLDTKIEEIIKYEDFKGIKENCDLTGDVIVIDSQKGVNQYGDFYSIKTIDQNGEVKKINLSISQMKDKIGNVSKGDVLNITFSLKYNEEDNEVYSKVKSIRRKDENNDFKHVDFIGKDDFSIEDILEQHVKGYEIKTLENVKEDWGNSQYGYEDGSDSQKIVLFLKSYKQTAKKNGYMIEVSDGEDKESIYISGTIDEKKYKENINLPIMIEIGKFNPGFQLFAIKSDWGKVSQPKFPGKIAFKKSKIDKCPVCKKIDCECIENKGSENKKKGFNKMR
jgi:DNA polymerase III alpha subunit